MGAAKVVDEQQASWETELSGESLKRELQRQETIPLKSKASPKCEDLEAAAPNDNTSEGSYSKRKAAIHGVSMFVLFGVAILITWLVLRPIYPATFAIDDIQIRGLSVNATTSTVAAHIAYNVTVRNQNGKLGYKYNWITVDASYNGWNFARSTIPKFTLARRSNATMHSLHFVKNAAMPPIVASSLAQAIQNGSVPLRVFAKAKLRMTIGKMRLSPANVNVDCRFTAVRAPTAPSTSTAFNVVSRMCRLTRPRYKKAKKLASYNPTSISSRPSRRGL